MRDANVATSFHRGRSNQQVNRIGVVSITLLWRNLLVSKRQPCYYDAHSTLEHSIIQRNLRLEYWDLFWLYIHVHCLSTYTLFIWICVFQNESRELFFFFFWKMAGQTESHNSIGEIRKKIFNVKNASDWKIFFYFIFILIIGV